MTMETGRGGLHREWPAAERMLMGPSSVAQRIW